MYSTIKRKHCICKECQDNPDKAKWPTFGCFSYFYAHLPEHLAKKAGTRAKVAKKNKNKRLAIAFKAKKYQREVNGENKLDIWFLLRRYEMKGRCSEPGCNQSTNVHDDKYFRWSIAHICPKSLIKSVAVHHENWLELCQEHHSMFDCNFEVAAKMGCFAEAKRKFQLFKELIPAEELRKINPYLL